MVLQRQVTLITGASRGFGLAAAEELTARGHPVIATMRNPDRDAPNLADLDSSLVEIARCDVTDRASIDAAVEAGLSRFGRVDALFNNAGYGLYGPVEDMSDDEVSRQMDTNFSGQIRMAQAVLPAMREQHHGKIINVSSLAGRIVAPLMGLYAASKWAVVGFTQSLAMEQGPHGIRVNALLPGMVEGGRIRAVIAAKAAAIQKTYEELEAEHLRQVSLRRMVDPDEIANMALFLCSEAGAAITGQALSVCGNVERML